MKVGCKGLYFHGRLFTVSKVATAVLASVMAVPVVAASPLAGVVQVIAAVIKNNA